VPVTRISACLSSLFCVFKRKYAFEDFAIRQVALLLSKTADEAKYANRSLVRAPFLVLQSQAFALKVSPRYQRTIGISGILMSRVTASEVKSFLFGMLFNGLRACASYKTANCIGPQASCRDASPTALLRRRTPQTVRPKTNKNESAHCKVTTLSAFMNRHPGNTAGSRLTTWSTSSL
jgi:hypothetical protein